MNKKSPGFAYTAAIAGGAILWLTTAAISGKAEAWDSSLYWATAYPLAIILAGALAYWIPERSWRWGLSVMLVQAVLLVFSGHGFGLLPLGLALFAVLALPAVGFARMIVWLRLRNEKA